MAEKEDSWEKEYGERYERFRKKKGGEVGRELSEEKPEEQPEEVEETVPGRRELLGETEKQKLLREMEKQELLKEEEKPEEKEEEELPEEKPEEEAPPEEAPEKPEEELPEEEAPERPELPEDKGEIKVILHVREGEYAPVGRFEFPNSDLVFEILTSSFPREKKYRFHHFNNVLVSKNHSEEVEKFLLDEARKLGYTLKIERR